jgi:hypothetical protein
MPFQIYRKKQLHCPVRIMVKKSKQQINVPIVKGSRQHVEYLNAHRILEDCEAQLPELKNRRELLKGQIEISGKI